MKNDAKIILGFRCNNSCVFCYEKENRDLPDKTTSEIYQEILAAKKNKKTSVHLIGGEPTIREDIVDIVSFARAEGFKNIQITTNGRMFSYPEFAKKIIGSGLSNVIFSIHGQNALVHDSLTKSPGSFDQLTKGISHLRKMGFFGIGANVTVCAANYHFIPALAEILLENCIERATFIFVIPFENSKFKQLAPPISKAAGYIKKALEMGEKAGYDWILLNPPMGCYFSDIFDRSVKYGDSRDEELIVSNKNARKIHQVSKNKIIEYIRVDKCRRCAIRRKCSGVMKQYIMSYGGKEIKEI